MGVNFEVTEETGCRSLLFTDTTGTYNAETNTGGYGTPNPDYSDIGSTLIVATLDNGQVVEIDDFIPTAEEPSYTITGSVLGYGDNVIAPQVVNIQYYIYTTAECQIAYKQADVLLICALKKCIVGKGQELLADCDSPCCNGAEKTNRIIDLIFRFEAMLIAATRAINCVRQEVKDLWNNCKADCPDCN